MIGIRMLALLIGTALVPAASQAEQTAPAARRFEWTTKSDQAKQALLELQEQIENFQFGATNLELANKIMTADPNFAIGMYYLSVVTLGPQAVELYQKSRELAKNASDGERGFIEAMSHVRLNQGVDFAKSIEPLEALARDYPGERLIQVILGQLYNGNNQPEQANAAFLKAQQIGPKTARVEAFLASIIKPARNS